MRKRCRVGNRRTRRRSRSGRPFVATGPPGGRWGLVHARLAAMSNAPTPFIPDRVRPLRRQEYDKLIALGAFQNEKIELLEGWLVKMSPIGAPHCSAVDKLNELLLPQLLGRATVRVQSPFAALDLSEPEPDIAIVQHGFYDTEHPEQA